MEGLKWLPEFIADAEIHKRMMLFHKVMVARKMRQAVITTAADNGSDVKNISKQNNIINN